MKHILKERDELETKIKNMLLEFIVTHQKQWRNLDIYFEKRTAHTETGKDIILGLDVNLDIKF